MQKQKQTITTKSPDGICESVDRTIPVRNQRGNKIGIVQKLANGKYRAIAIYCRQRIDCGDYYDDETEAMCAAANTRAARIQKKRQANAYYRRLAAERINASESVRAIRAFNSGIA